MHNVTFETVTCTIKNPLTHPRSVFDGLANSERIWIDPGQVKENVLLAKHMADMLMKRTGDLEIVNVKPASSVKAPRPALDDVPDQLGGGKGRAA
jgi:hypothetical protein